MNMLTLDSRRTTEPDDLEPFPPTIPIDRIPVCHLIFDAYMFVSNPIDIADDTDLPPFFRRV